MLLESTPSKKQTRFPYKVVELGIHQSLDVPFENGSYDISNQTYDLHDFSPNITFHQIDSDFIISDKSIFQIDH